LGNIGLGIGKKGYWVLGIGYWEKRARGISFEFNGRTIFWIIEGACKL
jgi:hypothetical protein